MDKNLFITYILSIQNSSTDTYFTCWRDAEKDINSIILKKVFDNSIRVGRPTIAMDRLQDGYNSVQ